MITTLSRKLHKVRISVETVTPSVRTKDWRNTPPQKRSAEPRQASRHDKAAAVIAPETIADGGAAQRPWTRVASSAYPGDSETRIAVIAIRNGQDRRSRAHNVVPPISIRAVSKTVASAAQMAETVADGFARDHADILVKPGRALGVEFGEIAPVGCRHVQAGLQVVGRTGGEVLEHARTAHHWLGIVVAAGRDVEIRGRRGHRRIRRLPTRNPAGIDIALTDPDADGIADLRRLEAGVEGAALDGLRVPPRCTASELLPRKRGVVLSSEFV